MRGHCPSCFNTQPVRKSCPCKHLSPPWVACRQPYPGLLARYSAGMSSTPWQMMLMALAGWINEQQLGVIEYLKEENRVLREQLAYGAQSRSNE